MTPMRCLYIDMNSFFASVEQHVDPSLRGKPVAITAVTSDAGACVAASYEAKAFGIKVGTRVYDAKRMCPRIVFRPSRHRLYVRMNQKIARVIDKIAELEYVRSVDEFQVALGGSSSNLDIALELGNNIKTAIREKIGSDLKCSVGIGPNHLLAKIAGKIQKPDGLEWLAQENMPGRISHLSLDDLPGISRGIRSRLYKAGIWSIPDLYALDPYHARKIWHSVEGERFVLALQGMDIRLPSTKRRGYGNSKVLAPAYRRPEQARLVGRWLVEKATERMRRDGYCAGTISVQVRFSNRHRWAGELMLYSTQDTRKLLTAYETVWKQHNHSDIDDILSVSVQLGNLVRLYDRPGDLFLPRASGDQTPREKLALVIDQINRRYKKRIIRYGDHQEHPGFFERG